MRLAIIGGTGKEGGGLAARWSRAGHSVFIGSRDAEKARAKAEELRAAGMKSVEGGGNPWAVQQAEVAILTVPYAAHGDTLRGLVNELADRILVDITVPLVPPKVSEVHLPAGQAAALEAQAIVGANTRIVASLHHVSSVHLGNPDAHIDTDVLLCGDDAPAKDVVSSLIADLGLRAIDSGPLKNAVALEALTPVLLYVNKKYKVPGSGIRITGVK